MLLSDKQIRSLCTNPLYYKDLPLITPFLEGKQEGVMSYGLTSAGYDLTLSNEFYLFNKCYDEVLDPKKFNDLDYQNTFFDYLKISGKALYLPSLTSVLGRSLEWINMPDNLSGTCVGKSTYARCGILVNITPLEPGWRGNLTIEIFNSSPNTVCLYVGEGICQLQFHVLSEVVDNSYQSKGGKYQDQKGVVLPRVK